MYLLSVIFPLPYQYITLGHCQRDKLILENVSLCGQYLSILNQKRRMLCMNVPIVEEI